MGKFKALLEHDDTHDERNGHSNLTNSEKNTKNSANSSSSKDGIEIDPETLFLSSEIERSAYTLSSIQYYLSSLSSSILSLQMQQQQQPHQQQIISQPLLSYSSILSLHKSLELQNKELVDSLIKKIKVRLTAIFNQGSADINNVSSHKNKSLENDATDYVASKVSEVSVMSCAYCIRALAKIRRGEIAEEVFSQLVVEPLIK